ncbi:unnamed protein product [Adineta steineri]|uniref:F-box domain-containing protein n=1 Tax=Adineta steineri TaxID=433720 RepID=A0A819XEF7_9BILA|nr:unnamed protein product [Adineta steineri]
MKFELLPNEILLDYFGYFNALDLFYAYDGLNYRLNKLIRILPLHLNFQYANKSKFGEFCRTMSLNEELKNQIYSLHLSNRDTDFQSETFLSFFSLNQFTNLQSLSITEINPTNSTKIKLMLPSISKLQTLSIISSDFPFNTINEILFIKNLTISYCFLNELYQLLQHMPILKYLNIQCLNDDGHSYDTNRLNNTPCAIHLKEMIIEDLQCTFMNFEIFVKEIPNLQILTISARNNSDMFDANLWEQLIRILLPHLITFNFKFGYIYKDQYNIILNKFQTNFWQKQYNCFTEYMTDKQSIFIYTIPYISNKFRLTSSTTRYNNTMIDKSDDRIIIKKLRKSSTDQQVNIGGYQYITTGHIQIISVLDIQSPTNRKLKKRKRIENNDYNKIDIFKNVTDLTLHLDILTKECSYYFANVTSLRLVPSAKLEHRTLTNQHIRILKTIINLFNLKHLNIGRIYGIENSLVLLEILKQSPKLSSITFIPKAIIQLFDDDELCKYLNKMIKKIILTDYFEYHINTSERMKQFCQIFSNIEYLECKINSPDSLLLLLNYLPKLSSIKAIGENKCYPGTKFSPFENALRRLNVIFNITHVFKSEFCETRISIWIGNKII